MPGWLTRSLADVPADDAWLSPAERAHLARLALRRRRAEWRLGRWAAKAAVGTWLGVPQARVEILAAPDGAPEAWLDAARAPVSVSLSHRAGRALAVVVAAPARVGCDLERVEPRSDAFVRTWLAPSEQEHLAAGSAADRARAANLLWCAKEAAAKLRREGLRLDPRDAVVTVADPTPSLTGWRPLHVSWRTDDPGACVATTRGWWRAEPEWCMVVVGDRRPEPPEPVAEEHRHAAA